MARKVVVDPAMGAQPPSSSEGTRNRERERERRDVERESSELVGAQPSLPRPQTSQSLSGGSNSEIEFHHGFQNGHSTLIISLSLPPPLPHECLARNLSLQFLVSLLFPANLATRIESNRSRSRDRKNIRTKEIREESAIERGEGEQCNRQLSFVCLFFVFFSREEKKVKTKRYRKTRDKSVGRGEANNWTVPLGG